MMYSVAVNCRLYYLSLQLNLRVQYGMRDSQKNRLKLCVDVSVAISCVRIVVDLLLYRKHVFTIDTVLRRLVIVGYGKHVVIIEMYKHLNYDWGMSLYQKHVVITEMYKHLNDD